jgi:hypothetical protein
LFAATRIIMQMSWKYKISPPQTVWNILVCNSFTYHKSINMNEIVCMCLPLTHNQNTVFPLVCNSSAYLHVPASDTQAPTWKPTWKS